MKNILASSLFLLLFSQAFAQIDPLWMRYPSISPDGSMIAFSYMGDVYTVPTEGGTAIPLTVHEAYDYAPVWSPDSKSIAFASYRYGNPDIFLVPADGGEVKRLSFHSNGDMPSSFSPDGKYILFSSARLDKASNQQFPSGALPELYRVPVDGGRVEQVLTTPALDVHYNNDMSLMVFHDQKGYEDDFRKHHTSSVTRDIWSYAPATGEFKMLSKFEGEDRNPVFDKDQKGIYYLSEQNGSYNIHHMDLNGGNIRAVTNLEKNPVRYLSIAQNGTLCYTFEGEIYTLTDGGQAQKVAINIATNNQNNPVKTVKVNGGINDVEISPNGKEMVFVHRGEVFVASIKEGTTKRITNTPEQERSVYFSPDGRSILYSAERNGSWNLYQSKIAREDEKYFFNSTIVTEEPILESDKETFQATYSPDGKEVAFLEERTALKVINLETKAIREIMPAEMQYSYSDGDQFYEWSPDGKWFLVGYLPDKQWIEQIGLAKSDGSGEIVNLTHSGYGSFGGSWMMDGKMFLWYSGKDGMKSHASWGSEVDVYAAFFTQEAYDVFKMNEEEYELYKEMKEEADKKEDEDKDDKKKKKKDDEEKKDEIKPIKIELNGLEDRMVRLTPFSSQLSSAYVSKDGTKLFYLTTFEKGFDLWQTNLKTRESKVLAKLGQSPGGIVADKEGKFLYVIAGGGVTQVNVESGETKGINVSGEMELNEDAERAYLFEHAWRQVLKKFYVKDLHGVDWDYYKQEYGRYLPHINNNYDFADMLSELLGELNASHTGSGYRDSDPNGDRTASLGLFYDLDYKGDGLKIEEVMDKSPVIQEGSKIKAGVIIEKIDGEAIKAGENYFPLFNRKSGKNMLLSLYDPASKKRWEETVEPIGQGQEFELRYERWVKNCRKIVEEQSGGKVGYVHVRSMSDHSFRTVYDETLGKCAGKDALVVDTRFNGGGWLHDDLATFLNGKDYITFMPRGQELGNEPQFKWRKPSVVVMGESNYSDAHMFPYTYRALGIGKLVGMPVPGTGTAVWWETLMNGAYFGIPQVGMVDTEGDYLENKQLEPDVKVENLPGVVSTGRDQQLEKAVQVVLQ